MRYPITPVPKPRMTVRDAARSKQNRIQGMRPSVRRYLEFKDACAAFGVHVEPEGAHVVYEMPMPAFWSEKKKRAMAGKPHRQRPDLDNLVKALLDAVWANDACVWDLHATKVWAREGAIVVHDGLSR